MWTVYVENIGYVYCTRQVGWAERMPAGAKWLGVASTPVGVRDVYAHPAGNFTLKEA